jgi:DNA-binding MarR family transcriptional regulator
MVGSTSTPKARPANKAKRKPAPRRASAASPVRIKPIAKSDFQMTPTVSRLALLDEGSKTDHRFRQLLYDFSTLGTSLEIARSYLASLLGLSSPRYNVLMVIASRHNEGGIGVSDVAKRLHVSTAFITSEVGKLEESGLVEKRPNPKDGRGVLLCLAPGGKRAVQHIGPERRKVNDKLFGSLSAKQFRMLSETLSMLLGDFAATVRTLESARDAGIGPMEDLL